MVMPTGIHINKTYANNRAEVSHEPTGQQENPMRGLPSAMQAHWILTLHGLTQNVFGLNHDLMQAVNYRLL